MATLPPLALVQDLSEWLGEPITEADDVARAGRVLAATSNVVRAEAGQTWPDLDVPGEVLDVVLAAAGRFYTNPEGWRDERTDDWAGQGKHVPEAGIFLTVTERRVLREYRPKKPAGIGVLGTTREPGAVTSGLVPTPDGQPIPWY